MNKKTDLMLSFSNKTLTLTLSHKNKIFVEASGICAKLAYAAVEYGRHSLFYQNIFNVCDRDTRVEALKLYEKIKKTEKSLMDAEEFYVEQKVTPDLKSVDKFAPIFNYHELITFAEQYAESRLSTRSLCKEN